MARLPWVIACEGLELRRWGTSFAEPMLSAIGTSFEELQQWMSWAQEMPTIDNLRQVLLEGQLAFDADRAWEYAIFQMEKEQLVGGADFTRQTGRAASRSGTGSVLIGPVEVSQQL
jgi:hypothetical protein